MNDKEKELATLDEMSYNLCEGGKGGFGYINEHILDYNLRKKGRMSANKKMSEIYGVVNPGQLIENRKKSSERMKKMHLDGKLKAPNWKGKKHSPETIQKMKESHKKRRSHSTTVSARTL